ncbi:uncharacterized protein Z518_03295 [Rhinocladiella mackenziei CBS 650.93]|uniref:Rhinocladiella mackenziei CBS 650.93 unplaced genomic scaffold supercont1.2, whole genome shotgun sequence n=1 Tax=Rhinocladiella mackenziei CBS 650.93 TaxID=1442369 RepID=A0A0D2HDM0_9EURO|nr:uncharacterized protein Z518_03295 [Rhinocladiella mackenziei CBS 650.93]KIX08638.1 hypothetical protein Z518_03295 [Rhinocladiella mackenziei CBS 650.93]
MSAIALASQIFGFIFFHITLATLIGVHRDLISAMQHVHTTIPVMLGNLQQEIEIEKSLRYRNSGRRPIFSFPLPMRERPCKHSEVAQLLEITQQPVAGVQEY